MKDVFLKYFPTTYAIDVRACVRLSSFISVILNRSLSAHIIRNCHFEIYVVVLDQNALVNTFALIEVHRYFNVTSDVVT